MRIISDFHDYYDCVQRDGIDKSLVYIRKTESGPILRALFPVVKDTEFHFQAHGYQRSYIQCSPLGAIGFAGKVYPIIFFGYHKKHNDKLNEIAYSIDDIDKYVDTDKRINKDLYYKNDRNTILKSFLNANTLQSNFINLFMELNTAIFIQFTSDYHPIIINPYLKEYKFFRIMSPAQAYQELSMFWGSMAHPEKPIPKISDKIMAEAKGFDKFSFRKDKSKND